MPGTEHQPVNALFRAAAGERRNACPVKPQADEANALDRLFTKCPFFGSRQISPGLARNGIKVGSTGSARWAFRRFTSGPGRSSHTRII